MKIPIIVCDDVYIWREFCKSRRLLSQATIYTYDEYTVKGCSRDTHTLHIHADSALTKGKRDAIAYLVNVCKLDPEYFSL